MPGYPGYHAQIIVAGKTYPIERDVTHTHPPEVHEALGTDGSEAAIQRYLDQCYVGDWYDDASGQHMGADPNGLELFWLDAKGERVTRLPDDAN